MFNLRLALFQRFMYGTLKDILYNGLKLVSMVIGQTHKCNLLLYKIKFETMKITYIKFFNIFISLLDFKHVGKLFKAF